MSKHTPGPWIHFFKNKYLEWHVGLPCGPSSDAPNMNIALCPDGVPGSDLNESEANARLIAAAPELLEALKELVSYAEHPDFDGAPSDASLAKAKAVVAKAECNA